MNAVSAGTFRAAIAADSANRKTNQKTIVPISRDGLASGLTLRTYVPAELVASERSRPAASRPFVTSALTARAISQPMSRMIRKPRTFGRKLKNESSAFCTESPTLTAANIRCLPSGSRLERRLHAVATPLGALVALVAQGDPVDGEQGDHAEDRTGQASEVERAVVADAQHLREHEEPERRAGDAEHDRREKAHLVLARHEQPAEESSHDPEDQCTNHLNNSLLWLAPPTNWAAHPHLNSCLPMARSG